MIPMISNVAGAAQAQRFNAFNQNKADQTAKDAAARAVRDRLMLGLVDAGVNAAMTFGGKAYDEATTGKRAQQQLDDAKAAQSFNEATDLAKMGIDQPAYDLTRKVKEPGYGLEGEMGKGRMERAGPDTGLSAAVGSPVSREMGPRQTGPGAMRDVTPTEALDALTPLQRAAQTALNRSREEARRASEAAARRQQYEDTFAERKFGFDVEKAQIDSQSKAAEAIKGLAPSRYTVPPYKATPGEATPGFGLQRVDFGPQSRAASMGGGRGGARAPTQADAGPLAEPVELIAAREGRRGDPTTGSLTRTIAARGEWAQAAIKNPAKYGLTPAEAAKVAQGLRIAQANMSDPNKADLVQGAIAAMDEARKASIARVGPLIAQVGDTLGTSPTEMARQQQAEADRADARERQQQSDAARVAAAAKSDELAKLEAQNAKLAANERAFTTALGVAKTIKSYKLQKLTPSDYANAMLGAPPPDGLTAGQLEVWDRARKDGAPIRAARDERYSAADRVATVKTLSTEDAIRAAFAAGKITRQQAADAFRRLGVTVDGE